MSARTSATQPLQTGYGTLFCNEVVFANVIYSFYAPNGTKLAEATVFSATEYTRSSVVFDVRAVIGQVSTAFLRSSGAKQAIMARPLDVVSAERRRPAIIAPKLVNCVGMRIT